MTCVKTTYGKRYPFLLKDSWAEALPLSIHGNLRLCLHVEDANFSDAKAIGGYPYMVSSPFHVEAGLRLLQSLKNVENVLDLGCGLSPFLLTAQDIGYDVLGIEYDTTLAKIASLYHPVITGNLLNWSSEVQQAVETADFIYSYRPIISEESYLNLVRKVLRHAKKNVVFFDPYLASKHLLTVREEFSKVPVDSGITYCAVTLSSDETT